MGQYCLLNIFFSLKPDARLIIIGSESGYKWSFNKPYAFSKSSLKLHVKHKKLSVEQQLLLISPSTISDFGITLRRDDQRFFKKI